MLYGLAPLVYSLHSWGSRYTVLSRELVHVGSYPLVGSVSQVIRRIIKRSKSASLIIFSVAAVMGLSTILMTVTSKIQVIKDID